MDSDSAQEGKRKQETIDVSFFCLFASNLPQINNNRANSCDPSTTVTLSTPPPHSSHKRHTDTVPPSTPPRTSPAPLLAPRSPTSDGRYTVRYCVPPTPGLPPGSTTGDGPPSHPPQSRAERRTTEWWSVPETVSEHDSVSVPTRENYSSQQNNRLVFHVQLYMV